MVESGADRVSLPIEGTTCASSAQAVERAFCSVNGDKQANVNLATDLAMVIYDPQLLKIHELKQAVSAAGYRAVRKEVAHEQERLHRTIYKAGALIMAASTVIVAMNALCRKLHRKSAEASQNTHPRWVGFSWARRITRA